MSRAGTELSVLLLGLGGSTQLRQGLHSLLTWASTAPARACPLLSPEPLVLHTSCSHSLSLRAPASPQSQSRCDLSLAQSSGGTSCSHSAMRQSLGPCWQRPHLQPSDTDECLCTAKWKSPVFGSGTPQSSVQSSILCRLQMWSAGGHCRKSRHTHQSTASLLSAAVASGAK